MAKTPDITPVHSSYRHSEKAIRSQGIVQPNDSHLKWYDIACGDQLIAPSTRSLAQRFLSSQSASSGVPNKYDLGFVLLHRCGEGFYFLMLCTWRENNELWKTVYYFDAQAMSDFELFPQDTDHKGTFCVWEMSVVSHEAQVWTAYLMSDRTQQDVDIYLSMTVPKPLF